MAIAMNIYYVGEGGNARKFAEEMIASGIVDKVRGEKGNLRYEYFVPMGSDDTVLLIDEWEDQKALDVHHALPLMNDILRLREKYCLKMKAERFVSDDESVTENDKKYIAN